MDGHVVRSTRLMVTFLIRFIRLNTKKYPEKYMQTYMYMYIKPSIIT